MRDMDDIRKDLRNEREVEGDVILLVKRRFFSGDCKDEMRIIRAFGNTERLEEFRQHRSDLDLSKMSVRLQSVEH